MNLNPQQSRRTALALLFVAAALHRRRERPAPATTRSWRRRVVVGFLAVVALMLGACNADTEPATQVSSTSATLHATVDWDQGEDVAFWFEVAYAIGLLSVGRVLDWIGTRLGFALAMIFWSAASSRLHLLQPFILLIFIIRTAKA